MTIFSYPKNADAVSIEERRLIDEAITAGKVTVCPPFTFSGALEERRGWINHKAIKRQQKRREQVKELAHLPASEIAHRLGVDRRVVQEDLREMGLAKPSYDVAKFWR